MRKPLECPECDAACTCYEQGRANERKLTLAYLRERYRNISASPELRGESSLLETLIGQLGAGRHNV